ncbi:MAG: 50S ribosomal protein L18 [SAR202 cluster bacterium]|nr:50S ribosomal protein L18 [SAR202 cluster bacterium]|tara:strand:- start:16660 stop:17028 length:369 start_codon:yes stop_codon:yes gene_type:complete
MSKVKNRFHSRVNRKIRVRKKITGSSDRPRLSVFRSLKHIYAQIIDDSKGMTLASSSSIDSDLKSDLTDKDKSEVSNVVGKALAQKASKDGISQVVFDRSGFKYHGRVKALAEGAREGGLKF